MSDFVPEDVLAQILVHLPTKSLVRATCVCKSWYSLITSSEFITAHLKQTRASNDSNNTHLILLRYYPGHPEKERHALLMDNETFDRYDDVEFPVQSIGLNHYFRVLGSCNGLVCLSDDFLSLHNTFVLWNPTIRKSLTLPLPEFTYQTHGPFEHVIGFGFDLKTNDYKVVRIVYLEADEGHLSHSSRVELYRLSTRSWVTITTNLDSSSYVSYRFSTQAFINGAVHWPACKRDVGDLIVSFDMSDEVFCEIRLPASYKDDGFEPTISLAVCGVWLSFFNYQKNYYNQQCSLWVMKEYGVVDSWIKLYTIDLNGGLGKTLGFRRNGEILLAMTNKELASYDPVNQQIKYLGFCDSAKKSRRNDLNIFTFHVDAYVESLVLVGDTNKFRRAQACDAREEERKSRCAVS